MLSAVIALLAASQAFAADIAYRFDDGNLNGWAGDAITNGPWSGFNLGWYGASGSVLKADAQVGPSSAHYLRVRRDQNLSTHRWISCIVGRTDWNNVGMEIMARIYVKTGSSWAWSGEY
jgi:mannan endo-1,4-beta-mannosidase